MASYTSPYATAFKSALKRGTSFNTAVNNIASRTGKSPDTIWQSLYKAGLCFRQKFNGQWIYCPWDAKKTSATTNKTAQFNSWQWFTEWCITSGQCTPEQLWKHCGSQQTFMSWNKKFWGRQFTWTTSKSTGRKTTTKSSHKSTRRKSGTTSYKFRSGTARKTTRRAA